MKISVIIPVCNGEKYVKQCIENVLCQTYKDIEIIVVNDGSTDSSVDIIQQYTTVKLINQSNHGLSAARNRGVTEATGDYVHFLDVDDLICLDYYTRMIEAIKLTGADIAMGEVENEPFPNLSLSFSERMLLVNYEDRIFFTNAGLMVCAWRFLIKRTFIEANKDLAFRASLLFEDVYFTLDAVRLATKIVTVPGATYYYRKRKGSILNSHDKKSMQRKIQHWSLASEFRVQLFSTHNLGNLVTPMQRFEYKILGIPTIKKIVFNSGQIKWYFFGVCVVQTKVAISPKLPFSHKLRRTHTNNRDI